MSDTKTNNIVVFCQSFLQTNPANILTHARTPLVIISVCHAFHGWIFSHTASVNVGLIILILAALTDLFDGLIARQFSCASEYGALLDTTQDKIFLVILISSSLAPIARSDPLHFVILALFLTLNVWRDNYVMMYRLIGARKGQSGKAQWFGKVRTFACMVFGCFLYAYAFESSILGPPNPLTRGLCFASEAIISFLTIASWIGYAKHYSQ